MKIFILGLLASLCSPLVSQASSLDCVDRLLHQAVEAGTVKQDLLSQNRLSLTSGPYGLLLELAAGDWGSGLGQSIVLQLDCDKGNVRRLLIAGAEEISDPWFDSESGRLWFVSRQLQSFEQPSESTKKEISRDIFFSDLRDGGWGPAQRLAGPVNSEADEYSPVVRNGHLYFASARSGQGDLYVSSINSGQQDPEPLPAAINSQHGEWNLWVSEDENLVVFESSGRVTNVSVPGDLYLSEKDSQGRWRPAVPLVDLNGQGSDLNPSLIGDELVFISSDPKSRRAGLRSVPLNEQLQASRKAYQWRLLFAGRSSHELGVIGLEDGGSIDSVGIQEGPHLLARDTNGHRVAVAAYGIYPRPHSEVLQNNPGWVNGTGGRVLVWDSRTGESKELQAPCDRPHGAAWQDATHLWVSCEDRNGLGLLQMALSPNGEYGTIIDTGHAGAHVLTWDAERHQILATHTEAGGLWFGTHQGGEFLALAPGSEALQILPGEPAALVAIGPAGQIARIDLESRSEVVRWDTTCKFPIDFAVDRFNRIWLACMFGNELLQIDPNNGEVLHRISLPGGPLNIEVHPQLDVIYASIPRRNEILEIPLSVSGYSRAFQAGIEPDGLAIIK